MRNPSHIRAALQSGGFSFHRYIGCLFKVGFLAQCCIIAAIAASAILIASIIDRSLILNGRDVGLLEHPAIWAFIGLQIALPISILYSLKKLLRAHARIQEVANVKDSFVDSVMEPILEFLRLQNKESKLAATVFYCVGLTAFVWNTYQNQRPGIIVPYDFWDSNAHFCGFWITRIYKLYLFCWLLPYIAMIHAAILVVTLRLIGQARASGRLKLIPFHPDGVGGFGFMPGLVTTPIIVTMLMGSIPAVAAFGVHRAADVTPLMGSSILVLWTGVAYIVPILFLRAEIVILKREMIGRLRQQQQAYYSKITEGQDLDFETLRKGNEAFDYFEKVCERVQSISNYPHLKRLVKFVGLALTPTIISLALKLYEGLTPIIGPLLKKP